jgi:hypothetical protein
MKSSRTLFENGSLGGAAKGEPRGASGSFVAGPCTRVRDANLVVGHVENSISGTDIHTTGFSRIVRDKPSIFVKSLGRQRGRRIEVIEPVNIERRQQRAIH